jgi:hypothetical protein
MEITVGRLVSLATHRASLCTLAAGGSSTDVFQQTEKDCSWPDSDRPPSGKSVVQTSVCSAISSASSTSMPRYRTVLSSLEWPSNSCTALRFFVRR